jgi:hypothetical protein
VSGEEVTRQGGEPFRFFWQIAPINDNIKERLFLDDVCCFTDEAVQLSRFFSALKRVEMEHDKR